MVSLITKENSQFISAVRITMIIGLVFHHLFTIPNSGFFPRNSLDENFFNLANLLNSLIHWTAMTAVPLLSIISGYLYFNRPNVQHKTLLLKRLHSVFLPSVAWTTIWFVFAYTMVIVGRPYGLFGWLDYNFANFTWLTILNGVFGITEQPLAFQFWFIHDLVLTLILAPLISWLIQRFDKWYVLALMSIWLINKVPMPFFSLNVLFFFTLGAFVSKRSIKLEVLLSIAKRWQVPIIGFFIVMLFTRSFFNLHPLFASEIWLSILRLVGVVTVSIILFTILQRQHWWLLKLSEYSPYAFFIFATHYPVIEFFKILYMRIPLQGTATGQLLTLLSIPILTTMSCILSAKVLARFFPGLFLFLNGGRASQ